MGAGVGPPGRKAGLSAVPWEEDPACLACMPGLATLGQSPRVLPNPKPQGLPMAVQPTGLQSCPPRAKTLG